MLARSLAVALLLTATVLTGCLGAGDQAGPAQQQADAEDDDYTPPEALPDNRSGEFAAFKETNETEEGRGGLDHHHDYWAGRDRVDILAAKVALYPTPTTSGTDAVIRLPEGQFVYEATASVEFTISNPKRHACDPMGNTFGGKITCTDDNTAGVGVEAPANDPNPPTLKLEYLHAAASEWIPLGDLTWGAPLVIPISNPIETDMPHSTASLWQFRVVAGGPLDTTLTFDTLATIVKGTGNIPLWPGHPEFYTRGHYREVLHQQGTVKEVGLLYPFRGVELAPTELSGLRPDKLVSYGTKSLYVYANITDYKPTPGAEPTHWYLYFHNASGDWNITEINLPENAAATAKNLVFVLPVDDAGMDTPYATGSRWEFILRGTLDTCYGGCAMYEMSYDLTVIATDLVADTYTCGGVEETYCPKGAADAA